jgi:hypothetical protein
MNFNWFRGITKQADLTPDKYNKTWYQFEKFWNDHDSGVSPFTNISFSSSASTKTGNYTATASDQVIFINASSNLTLTLPSSSGLLGKMYAIFNIGTKLLTILTTSGQTINGGSSMTIPGGYYSLQIFSDGSNWFAR